MLSGNYIYFMKFHLFHLLLAILITTSVEVVSQTVHLTNRSFEDLPGPNKAPQGWKDCGYLFEGESPPDVQPCGAWKVTQKAIDGKTYVGMVVRENNTWEALAQELKGTLKKDSLYNFEILICTSKSYVSATRESVRYNYGKPYNYITPARLRIWGGNQLCYRSSILTESPLVTNNEWQVYKFTIKPPEDVSFIIFEAFYENELSKPYNGNILIDRASAFTPVNQTASSQIPVED